MASVTIQHGLFGIFCLLSTLTIADAMEMYTIPKILTRCGRNLTLKCDITAENELNIKKFYWMEKKEICDYTEENQTSSDFECKSLSYTHLARRIYNYSLTIFNIQPKHKGTYHCKLRSNEGVLNDKTIVRVQNYSFDHVQATEKQARFSPLDHTGASHQVVSPTTDCVGNSSTNVSTTVASCTFKDVYPEPIIQWNRGYENLTHLAATEVTENTEGLFTAVSTLKLRKDPSNRDYYNCSLFFYLENEKNETQIQWARSEAFADGHRVIGQWSGVMIALVLGMVLA